MLDAACWNCFQQGVSDNLFVILQQTQRLLSNLYMQFVFVVVVGIFFFQFHLIEFSVFRTMIATSE